MLNKSSTKGFTLVELMVIVAVIGILSMIAIPNFTGMIHRGDVRKTAEEFYNMAVTAQSQAEKTGKLYFISVDGANSTMKLIVDNGDGLLDDDDKIEELVTIPTTVAMGPDGGYSSEVLPAPYSYITPDEPCSFCTNKAGTVAIDSNNQLYIIDGSDMTAVNFVFLSFVVATETDDTDSTSKRLVTVSTTGDIKTWF